MLAACEEFSLLLPHLTGVLVECMATVDRVSGRVTIDLTLQREQGDD